MNPFVVGDILQPTAHNLLPTHWKPYCQGQLSPLAWLDTYEHGSSSNPGSRFRSLVKATACSLGSSGSTVVPAQKCEGGEDRGRKGYL